jgi:hypothetical protein
MDHAEAHEWLEDLVLDPRRLAQLEDEATPEAASFRAHVVECARCRADIDSWRSTHRAVLETPLESDLDEAPAADAGGYAPPPWLRERVAAIPTLAAARQDPLSAGPAVGGELPAPAPTPVVGARTAPARRVRRVRWPRFDQRLGLLAAGLAAVLVVALGTVAVNRATEADRARQETADLADLGSAMARVLADPGHTLVALAGLDGSPSGAAAWSPAEIVVASTKLAPPPPGMEYRCWLERDGKRTPIGAMDVEEGLAYWAGPLDAYDGLDLGQGGILGVSLEPVGGRGGNAPVIAGTLPG